MPSGARSFSKPVNFTRVWSLCLYLHCPHLLEVGLYTHTDSLAFHVTKSLELLVFWFHDIVDVDSGSKLMNLTHRFLNFAAETGVKRSGSGPSLSCLVYLPTPSVRTHSSAFTFLPSAQSTDHGPWAKPRSTTPRFQLINLTSQSQAISSLLPGIRDLHGY